MEPIANIKQSPFLNSKQIEEKHVSIKVAPEKDHKIERQSSKSYISAENYWPKSSFIATDIPLKIKPKFASETIGDIVIDKLNIKKNKSSHHDNALINHKSHVKNPLRPSSSRQSSSISTFSPLIMPQNYIAKNNEFINNFEIKTIKLNKYNFAENKKKFDQLVMTSLKNSLDKLEPTCIASIYRNVLEFCRETIITLFHNNNFTLEKYADFENEYINSILLIIQKGGILTRNILPRLIILRNDLSTLLLLHQRKTVLTEQLHFYLTDLTKTKLFTTESGDIIYGRDVISFLTDIDQMLSLLDNKRSQEIYYSSKEQKTKIETYKSHPIADLILYAIGGSASYKENHKEIIFVEATNIITFLRDWSKTTGTFSENFQTLKAYCNNVAQLCVKSAKLSHMEFHCHVDHFAQEADSAQEKSNESPRIEIQIILEPKLKSNLVNKAMIPKFTSSSPTPLVECGRVLRTSSLKGKKTSKNSYSTNPIEDAYRSLIPDKIVLPKKIIVNDKIFYFKESFDYELELKLISGSHSEASPRINLDLQERFQWAYTTQDPSIDFWFNLFKCFYGAGFADANDDQIKFEVNLMKKYHEKSRLLAIHHEILQKKLPCLKVVELMTLNCTEIANQYMMYLFPMLFPKPDEKGFAYSAIFAKKKLELVVEIESQDNFNVTQINQFDIYFLENKKDPIATVLYSWQNKMTEFPAHAKGWDAILKIDCKVHNMSHWDSIMEIITNANDLSTCSDLPGLHFSKIIRERRRSKG